MGKIGQFGMLSVRFIFPKMVSASATVFHWSSKLEHILARVSTVFPNEQELESSTSLACNGIQIVTDLFLLPAQF